MKIKSFQVIPLIPVIIIQLALIKEVLSLNSIIEQKIKFY